MDMHHCIYHGKFWCTSNLKISVKFSDVITLQVAHSSIYTAGAILVRLIYYLNGIPPPTMLQNELKTQERHALEQQLQSCRALVVDLQKNMCDKDSAIEDLRILVYT